MEYFLPTRYNAVHDTYLFNVMLFRSWSVLEGIVVGTEERSWFLHIQSLLAFESSIQRIILIK